MIYTNLGRSGLLVSKFCLGTMNFGHATSEADSHDIMDYALEVGINYFDTANRYGLPVRVGLTEEIIGRWLSQGGRREKIVLATKLHNPMGDGPNDKGLSAYHIRQACEDSLRRLKTDHIDVYQMHHIDRTTPWEEIWQAMEQLVREGKILYVGSSNFAGWHIAQANEAAKQRNFMGLVSEQSRYSLNVRTVELEVLPACQAYGVGVITWSPLGAGLLGGVLKEESKRRRLSKYIKPALEAHHDRLEAWENLCEELGEKPAAVALAWLLQNTAVTAPIIGPRTMDQFKDNLHALEIELSDETLTKIDNIWPGPGGAAPEAYAW